METSVRRTFFALCFAIAAIVNVLPAAAQRNTKFKKGDKVEVEVHFDWQPGTVQGIDELGWIRVKLDDDVKVLGAMRTQVYPPQQVRRSKTAAAATASLPERRWSDRTGKFSVQARFDGLNDGKVGLVKADGKRIEVPLDKLSEDDGRYVQKVTSAAENPFEAAGSTATIAEGTVQEVNWHEVEPIRPEKFPKWSFGPTVAAADDLLKLARAVNTEITLGEIPDSEKFFEDVEDIYVASDGKRAVVSRRQGLVNHLERLPYLEMVDLEKKRAGKLIELPVQTSVLDVDPDKSLVMYRSDAFHAGTKMELTIARIENDSLVPVTKWEPYSHEKFTPRRDVEKAWFLGGDRILTMNDHAEALTVWKVAEAKALMNIPVRTNILLKTAISPDRSLLGVVMQQGIAIIDLRAGRHVATVPTSGKDVGGIAFRGDNARLAAVSDQAVTVWDLTTGEEMIEFSHSVMNRHASLDWAGEFVLVGGRFLFDAERRILLWEYQDVPGAEMAAAVRDGRIWVVPKNRQETESTLITAALPDSAARAMAKKLPPADKLLVVKPGDSVSLEIDIDPSINMAEELRKSLAAKVQEVGQGAEQPNIVVLNAGGAQQDVVREHLANALEDAGLKVTDKAPLVLKAVCKPQPQQTIRINVDNRWPVRPEDIVERSITPHASYLELSLDGVVLWNRGYVATPGTMIFLNEGETLDQALERLTKPNIALFTEAKFSGYAARPGKATPNGAYGMSRFTSRGLIEGRSGDGDRVVFE